MKKAVVVILILAALIASAVVGVKLYNKFAPKPDYLLEGARDNGFVAAYRAYTGISGDKVKKIPGFRFENLVYLNKDVEYDHVSYEFHTYHGKAKTADPDTWEIEQNQYDEEFFDIPSVVESIKQMGLSYTGNVYILVTEFDDYRIVQVESLGDDNSTILDESFALFRNGSRIDLPENVKLDSIRTIYKQTPMKGTN